MNLWIVSTCCYLLTTQGIMISQETLTPQEAFFLRRVTEFWKDRDYPLVKKQIDAFLASHETSNIHNNLYALLGDILYQETNYAAALKNYNKISDPLLKEKTVVRRTQCLYLAGNYDGVIQSVAPLLESSGKKLEHADEMQFILGDSLFRKMRQTSDSAIQHELALKAKPLLLALFNTSYHDKVVLPLAEIHRELGEAKEASLLYLMLADKFSQQREDFLLQAAALQQHYDPELALTTFQAVVDMGGVRAKEAAHQELLLLFQSDRFSDLISRAPKLEMNLNAAGKVLFEFCLAHSYFKLDRMPEAIDHFTAYLTQEAENTPYKRATFLTLIQCAHKTEDEALFDRTLKQFLSAFPQDEEAGRSLLLHAQTALRKGDVTQASHDLNQLLKDFPNFPDQEMLLYDQALLLSKTQKWDESRSAFITYLGRYPSTPHSNLIWASIVHSSIEQLKEASSDEIRVKKAQLASDLAQALTLPDLFSPDEEASYQFLLGQLMFDLHQFKEAVQELDSFCQKYPEHASVSEAYLLQALSHRELKSDPAVFIPVAEKALTTVGDQTQKKVLRLQLFNTYLSLKEHDKAAESLYQAFIVDQTPVQQENQLWLTRHYEKKAESGDAIAKERMVELFKKVLNIDEMYQVHFDPAQTYLESETLKFAQLLAPAERQHLIQSLVQLQEENKALPWKMQGRALFELAKSCLDLNQTEEALRRLEELIAKDTQISSSIRSCALLEQSRILFSRCKGADLNEENLTLQSVLSTLKDLQIQKELSEEPVHLEAALDYADIRAFFAPPQSQIEAALFYLNRIKEDFNTNNDPLSNQYHESRLRFPEKDHLFQVYMKCLEAEILHWEIKEALQNGNSEKAAQSKQSAVLLFEEVLQDKQATMYIKQRAEAKLNDLRS